MNERVTFAVDGALAGARQGIPLALGVFAYGMVFGVLARQTGMSLMEAVAMSGLVNSGAQLVVLDLWTAPLPVLAIVLTTLVVNLRYLLMGAALQPWFSHLRASQAYISAFFMGDENWALTMREFAAGGNDGAFLPGSGLMLYLAWLGATVSGYAMGTMVQDPAHLGLDFAFPAVLVALLTGMWRGKPDLWPWIVAAGVAVLAAQWLPGKWYILLGGLVGSMVGAIHCAD